LKIPLPKAFTEEMFYPVYDLIYAQNAAERLGAFKALIVSIPAIGVLLVIAYWIWHLLTRKSRQVTAAKEAS